MVHQDVSEPQAISLYLQLRNVVAIQAHPSPGVMNGMVATAHIARKSCTPFLPLRLNGVGGWVTCASDKQICLSRQFLHPCMTLCARQTPLDSWLLIRGTFWRCVAMLPRRGCAFVRAHAPLCTWKCIGCRRA